MARIAVIDGAKLFMYHNDHPPPHFHVLFAEHRAVIDIKTLKVTRGHSPRPKLRAVVAWAMPRREQLLDVRDRTQAHLPAGDIA